MREKQMLKVIPASLAALSLLLLGACADENDEGQSGADDQGPEESEGGVYRLDVDLEEAGAGPYEDEVRIELPEYVVDNDESDRAQDYAQDRVLEAATVRIFESEDARCTLEIEYHYDENNLARIQDTEEWASTFIAEGDTEGSPQLVEADFTDEQRLLLSLGPVGANNAEELAANGQQPALADDVELSENGEAGLASVECHEAPDTAGDTVEVRFPYLLSRAEDPAPLDREAPEYQAWSEAQFQEADEALEEDAAALEGSTHFASVQLSVTGSGELFVVEPDIRDFAWSSSDSSWLPGKRSDT